jgi:hypothetical protein
MKLCSCMKLMTWEIKPWDENEHTYWSLISVLGPILHFFYTVPRCNCTDEWNLNHYMDILEFCPHEWKRYNFDRNWFQKWNWILNKKVEKLVTWMKVHNHPYGSHPHDKYHTWHGNLIHVITSHPYGIYASFLSFQSGHASSIPLDWYRRHCCQIKIFLNRQISIHGSST